MSKAKADEGPTELCPERTDGVRSVNGKRFTRLEAADADLTIKHPRCEDGCDIELDEIQRAVGASINFVVRCDEAKPEFAGALGRAACF